MIPTDPDDRDVLAGEYVLGHLDEAEAAEVDRAVATDADLAARIRFWEELLLPAAAAGIAPIPPDPATWDRIRRSLAEPAPAADIVAFDRARASGRRARRLWDSAPLWRAVAGLAAAAALLLAFVPAPDKPEPGPRYFAVLQARDAAGQETGPGWLIQIGEDGTVRSIPLGRVDPGQGRALQLWTLWDQVRGPVSLAVLPPGGSVRLPRDRLPVVGGNQLFEITVEPEAGSPTGRPTGRILFIGRTLAAPVQAL